MNNGTIITPLTPDENIEVYKETSNSIYIPSDSQENQTKEIYKSDINYCCKKWIFLEFIFLFFTLIINLLIITSIVIQFVYKRFPISTLIYGFSSLIHFLVFYEMIQKQKYGNSAIILISLSTEYILWGLDYFISFMCLENHKHIKKNNEYIGNFFKYSKFAEIPIWALLICLFMCLTYKKTGKICFDSPEE